MSLIFSNRSSLIGIFISLPTLSIKVDGVQGKVAGKEGRRRGMEGRGTVQVFGAYRKRKSISFLVFW